MMVVERLTPEWRDAFVASHNSLFTKISAEYVDRIHSNKLTFPVRTFIGREDGKVVAWGSFYLRKFSVYGDSSPSLKVAMACAIGTLPECQRQGLGRKVWRLAEETLAEEVDAVMLYTGEGGKGFPFYRAQGYLPLFYPRPMRLSVSESGHSGRSGVVTKPFAESRTLAGRRGEVFASCYRDYGGFMADRPDSLDQWGDVSFLYDSQTMGCTPQISWLEDTHGKWVAYAIWTGPIRKMGWKKDMVEIWELACADGCDLDSLRRLLEPVRAAACEGNRQIDWWAVPGHPLAEHMLALGFEERPRSLCVLGKIFDPARLWSHRLQVRKPSTSSTESITHANRRLELHLDGCNVEIEMDGATRMLFGRSTASLEHQQGLLTIRPLQRIPATVESLDRAFPVARWGYFASEFI